MDLTARAGGGLIDLVIGQETELQRIIQILCRKTKNNPIILGESGIGKKKKSTRNRKTNDDIIDKGIKKIECHMKQKNQQETIDE